MAAPDFGRFDPLGRSTLPMLNSFPIALIVSTILGFLAGLGVGGGSLLILWLTLVLEFAYPEAKVLNLLFFLPSAIIASVFRLKQGSLPIKKVMPAVLIGCIAAVIFSRLGRCIDTAYIKKFFGILLLFTGIREILYKPKEEKTGQT